MLTQVISGKTGPDSPARLRLAVMVLGGLAMMGPASAVFADSIYLMT